MTRPQYSRRRYSPVSLHAWRGSSPRSSPASLARRTGVGALDGGADLLRRGADQALAVDLQSGRALDAGAAGVRACGAHAVGVAPAVETGRERVAVQADVGGVLLEQRLDEDALVPALRRREQAIMILPEAALRAGALRGLGRPLRFVAQEGEMLPHDLHVAGRYVLLLDLTP